MGFGQIRRAPIGHIVDVCHLWPNLTLVGEGTFVRAHQRFTKQGSVVIEGTVWPRDSMDGYTVVKLVLGL